MDNESHQILIADDNSENLKVLSTMLRAEGYKIRVAKNGIQTLESIEAQVPDILLLDIHMPLMDGFEVCKTLKSEDSAYKHIPIIFLSALNDTFNKLEAFKAGASDYITKPFEIDEVKVRLKTHLSSKYFRLECIKLHKIIEAQNLEINRLKNHEQ